MSTNETTREELWKIIAQLREENTRLKEKIAELERRLNSNSQNSSKPPSSDGLRRPPKSLRKKGKNSKGGQKNHKGITLQATNAPDKIIIHNLEICPCCQNNLKETMVKKRIKRQVFEIPELKIEVTEYQSEVKFCAVCQKNVNAEFLDGVNAPVQYGIRVKSLSIYLQQQHFLPENRLQRLFLDIYNLPIAKATLSNFSIAFGDQLSDFITDVEAKIYKTPVKNLDETSLKVEKKNHWLHVASTAKLTSYRISKKRGDIPDKMQGVVVHDHFKPYFCMKEAGHALCNAHHLRELESIIEHDKEEWSKKMKRVLLIGCKLKRRYPKGIPVRRILMVRDLYDKIVIEGLNYHESLSPLPRSKKPWIRPKRRIGHNLLIRFRDFSDETLRFLYNPKVPFTNNQAEQDIRMMKVKQKISGCFRAKTSAEIFCRIRSFLSTARKQGWGILQSVSEALNGHIPILSC